MIKASKCLSIRHAQPSLFSFQGLDGRLLIHTRLLHFPAD
jgi:hypothetical protein